MLRRMDAMVTNLFKILGTLFGMVDDCNNKANTTQQEQDTCEENYSKKTTKETINANDNNAESKELPKKDYKENCEQNSSEAFHNDSAIAVETSCKVANYRREVVENYDVVTGQLLEVIKEQRSIQLLIEQLKDTTLLLGKSVRKSNMFEGIEKLIVLWRVLNKSSDELSQYYAQILYGALNDFGVEAIVPQPGDHYRPEIHQREDQSMLSNQIVKCERYNWGWKLDEIVLSKAVVCTSCEENTNE